MTAKKFKAPFPYFGGKSRVAPLVWARLGDCDNVIEPFCGSLAFLLARPHKPRVETVNDRDCYVANFWRATSRDPEAVAEHADWPVNEADLHARHRWLVLSEEAAAFRQRMRRDPDYYDARIAGWWCWGLCCWIGGGWCTSPAEVERNQGVHPDLGGHASLSNGPCEEGRRPVIANPGSDAGKGVHGRAEVPATHEKRPRAHSEHGGKGGSLPDQLPMLTGDAGASGRGVHGKGEARPTADCEQMPDLAEPRGGHRAAEGEGGGLSPGVGPAIDHAWGHMNGVVSDTATREGRPQLADAYDLGRGVNGNGTLGTCEARRRWLLDWFGRLRDRLRSVRVCCGSWLRVCDSESVTTRLGVTGIFFDPPYSKEAGRDMDLYACDSGTVAHDVRAYCLERGGNPMYRIALAGYRGEGHEGLEAKGWERVDWRAQGGYGNRSKKGRENARREALWFSPHCQRQASLFDLCEGGES